MKKERNYNDLNHLYGRIFLAIAIIIIVAIPIMMAIVLKVSPNFAVVAEALLGLLVFWVGGFVEVITYSPMLGTAGTYLGFFTGNLVNLKVPCVVNARELANVKHGSKEGEIISTISVATSTIVTTVIIALGVVLLIPLTPVFENPVLTPAFDSAFTALFAALAYKYFVKDPQLVPIPLAIALILQALTGVGTGVIIPVCSIVSILFAYYLFKNGGKLLKASKKKEK